MIRTKEEYLTLYEKHGSIRMMALALSIGEPKIRRRRNELFSAEEIGDMNKRHRQKPIVHGRQSCKTDMKIEANGSGKCEVWSFDRELYELTREIKKLELLRVQVDSWDAVRWRY